MSSSLMLSLGVGFAAGSFEGVENSWFRSTEVGSSGPGSSSSDTSDVSGESSKLPLNWMLPFFISCGGAATFFFVF